VTFQPPGHGEGTGSVHIGQGETVTITLDTWTPAGAQQASYPDDFSLTVEGKGQFEVQNWTYDGQVLTVEVTPDHAGGANLTGDVFEVTISALSDQAQDGGELIGFDINSATYTNSANVTVAIGEAWETNDDVLVRINDAAPDEHGNPHMAERLGSESVDDDVAYEVHIPEPPDEY